ncbi:unnamed protein product [Rotaria sp. Silwood2]|nr:unnamed protein product [Rotaria sp. Silwood2]
MAKSKRYINTSLLPDDILSYTDTEFYNVAKRIVGDNAAQLLEIQSIRSPDSFLFMPDDSDYIPESICPITTGKYLLAVLDSARSDFTLG